MRIKVAKSQEKGMTTAGKSEFRVGLCPVYDIECPSGSEAAAACENRFLADYNPLTNFRDSDIEHCAIYRREMEKLGEDIESMEASNKNKTSKDGE